MKIMHVSSIEGHPAFSGLMDIQGREHDVKFVKLDFSETGSKERYEIKTEKKPGKKSNETIRIKNIRKIFDHEYDSRMSEVFDRLLKEHRPDLIHVHVFSGFSLLPILNAASSLGIKKVLTLHDHSLFCIKGMIHNGRTRCDIERMDNLRNCDCMECRLFSGQEGLPLKTYNTSRYENAKAIIMQSDRIICPSFFQRRVMAGLFGHNRKLEVVYHGVDLERRRESKKNSGRTCFGYIGSLHKSKGVQTLMDAKNMMGDIDFSILICTMDTGNEAIKYLEKETKVKILENVPREELNDKFFSRIDYLVIPSVWEETGPMTLFEALSCGIPVIISDMESMKEKVEAGKNSFVFRDVSELKNIMEGIVKGQLKCINKFSPVSDTKKHSKQVERIYRDSLKEKKKILMIKLGYECNSRCLFCVTGDNYPKDFVDYKIIYDKLMQNRDEYATLVLTGGEPTMHKDFFRIIGLAYKLGYKIRMQTNGRMYYYDKFCEEVAKYNVFSSIFLCGQNQETHDNATCARGSFVQTVKGIRNLRKHTEEIEGKVIITRQNYRKIQDICRLFLGMGVENIRLVFLTPLGNAEHNFGKVVPSYSESMPYIEESLHFLESMKVKTIMVESIPHCLLKENFRKYVSEEIEDVPLDGSHPLAPQQDYNRECERCTQKMKFKECDACAYLSRCEGVYRKYAEEKGGEEFKPINVLPEEVCIELTKKCNLDCNFCFNKNDAGITENQSELTTEQALSAIHKIKESGMGAVRFTGGEPLLRNDLGTILGYAKSLGLYVILNTNGTLFSNDNLKILGHVDDILLSFHDMRASDTKEGIFFGIKNKNPRIYLRASTIATKGNIRNLEKFYNFFDRVPVDDWILLRPVPVPEDKKPINNNDVRRLTEKILKFNRKYRVNTKIANAVPFCAYAPEKVRKICIGGKNDDGHTRIVIDANGDIKPSYFIDEKLGNVGQDTLLGCWNHDFMKKMRSLDFVPDECKACDFLKDCRGGLRFAAKINGGSYHGKDYLMKGINPFVSVIIPTYNRKEILRLVLRSVIRQDYPCSGFEVIVADDGSTEGIREMVEKMKFQSPCRIKYYYQEHKGFRAGTARNMGAKKAAGDIFIFLNDDVVVPKDFIRNHVLSLKKSDVVLGYCASYGTSDYYDSDSVAERIGSGMIDTIPLKKDFREPMFEDTSLNNSVTNHRIWHVFLAANFSLRRSIFLDNLFDERFKGWGEEDVELGFRLFERGVRISLEKSCAGIHVHTGGGQLLNYNEEKVSSMLSNMRLLYKIHKSDEMREYIKDRFIHLPTIFRQKAPVFLESLE